MARPTREEKGEIWEITIWPISPDSPVHKLGLCNNWIYILDTAENDENYTIEFNCGDLVNI